MHSKAHLLGHPVHAMLVAFPIGMYVGSVIFDIFYLVDDDDPTWFKIAQYTLLLGIVGALVSAVPGFVDYLYIPRDWSAKVWGLLHAALNLTGTGFAIVSSVIRWGEIPASDSSEAWAARLLSWIGIGIAASAASIGGHLVYALNIGNANFPGHDVASLTPEGTQQHKHTAEDLAPRAQ
jgi:uncharacterized membrane protein